MEDAHIAEKLDRIAPVPHHALYVFFSTKGDSFSYPNPALLSLVHLEEEFQKSSENLAKLPAFSYSIISQLAQSEKESGF